MSTSGVAALQTHPLRTSGQQAEHAPLDLRRQLHVPPAPGRTHDRSPTAPIAPVSYYLLPTPRLDPLVTLSPQSRSAEYWDFSYPPRQHHAGMTDSSHKWVESGSTWYVLLTGAATLSVVVDEHLGRHHCAGRRTRGRVDTHASLAHWHSAVRVVVRASGTPHTPVARGHRVLKGWRSNPLRT
jgi:hypothetical protein